MSAAVDPQHPQQGPRGTRRTARRETRSPVDEDARRERLEQFHTRLSESVLSMTSGTAWADWLTTAARFHHYSFRNTVAIWAQRPEATQVAGYRVWQDMGRQVRKGERGIEILAPVTRRADDSDAAPRLPGGAGSIPGLPTPPARTVVGYRIAHVFDISQTDLMAGTADVFAVVQPALLTGQAPDHLWDGLARQVDEAGYRLVVEPLTGGANGRTHFVDRVVTVTPDLEPAHRAKTLSHEMAHITLHQPETVAAGTDSPVPACRGRIEVEAESVAYLIAAAHDLDASAFSFAYVAGWAQRAGGDVEQVLAETATRVLGAAHRILDRLDRDNPAPLPVPEDAVPFELPGPTRAPVVPASPVDPGRHPIVPLGATDASRGQAGVGR